MPEDQSPKKAWWKDWRVWSGIGGLILLVINLAGKGLSCTSTAQKIVSAPDRIADLEQRMNKNDTRDTLMALSVNAVEGGQLRMQSNVNELDDDINNININLARIGERLDVEMIAPGKEDSSTVSGGRL